jgi:hypothetical protein
MGKGDGNMSSCETEFVFGSTLLRNIGTTHLPGYTVSLCVGVQSKRLCHCVDLCSCILSFYSEQDTFSLSVYELALYFKMTSKCIYP